MTENTYLDGRNFSDLDEIENTKHSQHNSVSQNAG
jgi:hypothetical protein